MTLKLRQIHDALEGEVKQKRQKLVEIKRSVEERNSQVGKPLQASEPVGVGGGWRGGKVGAALDARS